MCVCVFEVVLGAIVGPLLGPLLVLFWTNFGVILHNCRKTVLATLGDGDRNSTMLVQFATARSIVQAGVGQPWAQKLGILRLWFLYSFSRFASLGNLRVSVE